MNALKDRIRTGRAVVTGFMRIHQSCPAIPLVILLTVSTTIPLIAGDPLLSYKWKHRLIVACVSTEEMSETVEKSLRERRLGIFDRDIVAIDVSADPRIGGAIRFPNKENEAIRRHLSISPEGDHFLLIGKDGIVKARQGGELSLEKFFALIDTMPMRREEMRRDRR